MNLKPNNELTNSYVKESLKDLFYGNRTDSYHKKNIVVCLIIILLCLTGCASFQKNKKLEDVAKNWCMTIRASQVIPVYPLTEDLQPGDIYLVQVPVDRQQEIYDKKGFLSLDNHIARLNPSGYKAFYANSFGKRSSQIVLPFDWLQPGNNNESWEKAPDTAFPSYSFSVRSGGGFNLALPIQGIPIGLSLLGSDAANGTISISKTSTYGVGILSLYWQVIKEWQTQRDVSMMLSSFTSQKDRVNYIRVVNRVFLVKELDISLRDSRAINAGVDAGLPRPVELPLINTSDDVNKVTAEAYKERVKEINEMLDKVLEQTDASGKLLPGASLRVASVSAGTIGLKETFDRPLVIGYLGFDMQILPNGRLGPPIPTHSLLERDIQPVALSFSPEEKEIRGYMAKLQNSEDLQKTVIQKLGGPAEVIYNMASEGKKSSTFNNLTQLLYIGLPGDADSRNKLIKVLREVVGDETIK